MTNTAIACSSVTILFATLILLFYSFFFIHDRSNADRVSLRCVVLASFTNIISCIFSIAMCFIRGDQLSCIVFDIFFQFLDVVSAGLLSVIGVNLVLIFVIKVEHTKYFERYYYLFITLYSLLLIIVPVYEMITSRNPIGRAHHNCWFFYNIGNRENNPSSWHLLSPQWSS
ncbi:hypothetical protein BX666DRAFT_836048 [Dichotomocladium elegans]|nr:hypothetical protein BX666DRAFT_836048 [Dichotomocladium elegans]